MPRPRPLPLDDALLTKSECGAICKVESDRWPAYARRFRVLCDGRRVVRVNPIGPGVTRWLKSALIRHMHEDLGRERVPGDAPTFNAGKRSGDLAGFMSRRAGSDSPARYPSAPVRGTRRTPPAAVTDATCPERGASARRAS